ncbi:glycosyltransferase family 4 protein [Gammaproteobacteria bacterium]|nr:glycosyltransferase family 4 protein [Gammaproteobacteria bacterium]
MGRNAAGDSFLKGYLQYTTSPELWIYCEEKSHAYSFAGRSKELGSEKKINAVTKQTMEKLFDPGCFFYPSPEINDFAYKRTFFGNTAWSLCGIFHTTSSTRIMSSITETISSPIFEWDALICPSQAVKSNVTNLLDNHFDYLSERLGITRKPMPQLPVIPLGINSEELSFTEKDAIEAREKLGIEKDSVVVLYVGRLSFHGKANPLPMYMALDTVANKTKKKIFLIECGWFANKGLESAFDDAFNKLTNNVERLVVDGRNQEDKFSAIAASDLFCSLVDNIQETFGITPIEAMAAGLPVLITDWNGYKESIEHGTHGFKVSTTMPNEGLGIGIAKRHALDIDNYDMYLGYTSSYIGVDMGEAAEYLSELVENTALRKKMGKAARERAVAHYDWKTIIPCYEALWSELAEIRQKASLKAVDKQKWTARPDPFGSFSHYPTIQLSSKSKVALNFDSEQLALAKFEELITLTMVNFTAELLPTKSHVQEIIHSLISAANKTESIGKLVTSKRKEQDTLLAVAWLLKIGLLQLVKPAEK